MYLKEINISNFRCFRRFNIQFAPGVTVLFGKNGSGKTTLIHAIHKAMSFMMYTDKVYESVLVKGKRKNKCVDVKTITNNNPYLHTKSFAKGDFNNGEDKFIEVGAKADFDDHLCDVEWKMSVLATNCKLRSGEFKDAFRDFYDWQLATGKLPLLAYVSDSFPHREDKKKKNVVSKIRKLRNFGYFDWDEEEGCNNEWIDRLETNLKLQVLLVSKGLVKDNNGNGVSAVLKEEDKAEYNKLYAESSAIESCFQKFTDSRLFAEGKGIQVLHLALGQTVANAGKLCVFTTDGREFAFSKLPAGYRRLFNIVLDLAYRSYILSHGTSTDISGLAIIDEIDLHLHPELEKVVLPQLIKTFTKLQFIVSTHSSLVLTGLSTADGKNKIMRMEAIQETPAPMFDVYGLDASTGLQLIMEVNPNDEELNRWISSAAYMKMNGMNEQYLNLNGLIKSKNLLSEEEIGRRIQKYIDDNKRYEAD